MHPDQPYPTEAVIAWAYEALFAEHQDHHLAAEALRAVLLAAEALRAVLLAAATVAGPSARQQQLRVTLGRQAASSPVPEPLHSLWQAVEALTPVHARVLTLRFGQGLSNQQLARVLNRSQTATTHLTQRALQALALAPGALQHAPDAPPLEPADPPGHLLLPGSPQSLSRLAGSLVATAPAAPLDPLLRRSFARLLEGRPSAGSRPPKGTAPDERLCYARLATPCGALLVAYRGDTVHLTDLGVPNDLFERECTSRLGERPAFQEQPPEPLAGALQATIDRGAVFEGKVDLSRVPAFQRTVLQETLKIGAGEVRPYGWLARAVGSPGAARAVGTSMAHNPIPILIPCHRVVRSDYRIGEYGCGGPTKKRELLAHEGVDMARLERLATRGVRALGNTATGVYCVPGCSMASGIAPDQERAFGAVGQALAAGFQPCPRCGLA